MIRSIGLAAMMLALPGAAAADVTEDYRRAFADVYPGDRSNAVEATLRGIDMIPQLEGNWAAAYLLMSDAEYSDRMIQRGCEAIPISITPTSPLEFSLVYNLRDGSSYTTRYAHAGGRYFQAFGDLAERIEVFGGGTPFEEMSDEMIMSSLITPTAHPMTRFQFYGPDVLVMEPVGLSPLILARCP